MKKHFLIGASLVFLAGCAKYDAYSLSSISNDPVRPLIEQKGVTAAWKVYDKNDSKAYLGRDVIAEGYVPIQMTIRNYSEDPVYLSTANFNIPLAPAKQVAKKVHTSTVGRVVGWSVAGLLFSPFIVPAIYDGIQSSAANKSLDEDYNSKVLTEYTLQPRSTYNGVVFAAKNRIHEPMEMYVINEKTQERITFQIEKSIN